MHEQLAAPGAAPVGDVTVASGGPAPAGVSGAPRGEEGAPLSPPPLENIARRQTPPHLSPLENKQAYVCPHAGDGPSG